MKITRQHWRRGTGLALISAAGLVLAACGDDGNGGADDPDFPTSEIRLIVQAAAGGGSDLSARALANELEEELGQSVVVENRPGASGSTAMQFVADQNPDGYTIGFLPVEVAMLDHLGFDVQPENYDLLGQIMNGPGSIAVPGDSPYETLDELLAAAGENPGQISVGNSGPGSIWEAATFGLGDAAGVEFNPVPFDGGADAVAAAMGGQIDAVVAGVAESSQPHAEGTLRVLAVLHDEEIDSLPDVPTAQELGHDVVFGGWGGIGAPDGLPDSVRDTLAAAIETGASADGFVETIESFGAIPTYRSPEEFTSFVDDEYERFAGLID
ncbi:tripartite tricarboxylate transporter substrate binding protein [Phytoactinopolyspora mesophila]|uniref:Tripartite tricarboxylate transporter substrate binding protein n=1 Tax=Phytoactinopolyspora mesophila TaxID=2650750 RepID=A0A7K3MCY5_9ACTN|nr:tripartite tricarboxylate transporter substrate binding protein [Phytoactinopolyspora mesophila]NDL61066.1 tripartite tricarboxylate transporter substrate binding protein [Phytoactinopolyspora mesophila]